LALLLFLFLNGQKKQREANHLQRISERYQLALNTVCGQYRQLAKTLYTGIVGRYNIVGIYSKILAADGDGAVKDTLRRSLYAKIVRRYKEFSSIAHVRQLHFHLANNESFLRVHRPDRFGDDLTSVRPTIRFVNKTHTAIDGFEEGRIYSGYRFVYPITGPQNNHLGSMEVSFGPDALTDSLMVQYSVLCNFFIRKDLVDQRVFPDEKSRNYLPAPLPGYVLDRDVLRALEIRSQTKFENLKIPQEARDRILSNVASGRPRSLYVASSNVVITTLPIFNPVTGKNIGFLTVRGTSPVFAQEYQRFVFDYTVGIVLIALVLVILSLQNTKKKLAEENARELRKQKRRLLEAQQVARLGHWELDLQSGELIWSEQIYHIFGVLPDEFGASLSAFLDCVHPDDRRFVSSAFQRSVERKQVYDIEHRIITGAGTVKWVRERAITHYSPSGDPLRSLGTVQDITDYKLLEEKLSRTLTERDAITSTVSDIMYMFDRQGILKWWNRSLELISGFETERMRMSNIFTLVVNEDKEKAVRAIEDIFTSGSGKVELRLQTTAGIRIFELNGELLELQDAIYLVGSGRDLTEQKEDKRQLAANALYLEAILASSTKTAIIATTPDLRIQSAIPGRSQSTAEELIFQSRKQAER